MMKCLTFEESKIWLAHESVRIDSNRNLVFSNPQEKVMMALPTRASALNWLSFRLSNWFSGGSELMFWMSDWQTEPAQPLMFFEMIRRFQGESRHLIDAPGHVFDLSIENDSTLLNGLIFLTMAYGWWAYLVRKERNDFVYLGDQHFMCSSENTEKMKEASDFTVIHQVRVINDIREDWE